MKWLVPPDGPIQQLVSRLFKKKYATVYVEKAVTAIEAKRKAAIKNFNEALVGSIPFHQFEGEIRAYDTVLKLMGVQNP